MVAVLDFFSCIFLILVTIFLCTLLIIAIFLAVVWGIVAIKKLLADWREAYG